MHIRNLFRLLFTTAVLLGWAASGVLAQGVTTSGVGGTVTDEQGKPLAGATVAITHVPSGTRSSTTTRSNGQYLATGLRVGGPYSITATAAAGAPVTADGIYLELGQTSDVGLVVRTEVVQLEKFDVSASRDTTFGAGKISTGTNYSSSDVANVATVRRNVQDAARLDSRLYLGSLDQGGQLSAQGQNFRLNSFLIDGVQANDSFGLSSNGFTSLRSPIPLEAIEALNIELNPYDVRKSGFTGVLMNAVVKSGTNEYRGMAYYETTDQDMRAKNPVTGVRDIFREKNWGMTLGGPILRDRLFFFASYDEFSRVTSPPNQRYRPTDANLTAIIERAKTFNYEPGSFNATNEPFQKTYLGKFDWNINESHRASFTYRKNDGQDTVFSNYTGNTTTSLSSNWYDQPKKTDSYTAQLFSNWTSDFRTEASVSYTEFDGSPSTRSPSAFPEIIINNVAGTNVATGAAIAAGRVMFGTEFSRQMNAITTKNKTAGLAGEYSWGSHTFLVGSDFEKTDIVNKFLQAYIGQYTFTNLGEWQAGRAASFSQAIFAPGVTAEDTIANFSLSNFGAFLQDTWKPLNGLTLMGGLRFDMLGFGNTPVDIPTTANYSEAAFRQAFGVSSTTTADGNYTVSPRVGFAYEFNTKRKTQLRGGIGLFQGKSPAVYLSNAYSNRGLSARITSPNVTFSPTGTVQGSFPASAVAVINFTDPGFRQPLLWKGNLALDHTLPFGGLIFTAEVGFADVEEGLMTTNLNMRAVGAMPDGRIRYAGLVTPTSSKASRSSNSNPFSSNSMYQNAGFADVYKFSNTSKGGGNDVTLSLVRPMKNKWSASLAWTHSHFTEVSPATSSVAQSNYNGRAVVNPNEDVASISNTNIKDRIVAVVSRRFELIKKAPTTVSVIYEGRTGHPYSFVYVADANGDGFTFNDLVYVPSGPDDSKVRWNSTTERDAFFAYVNRSGLSKYAGKVLPRNSETSPWTQTIDLKFTQVIPLYKRVTTEIYVNVLNFANLLSDKWGLLEEVPFSYKRALVSTDIDNAANNGQGQYIYSFTSPGTLEDLPITARDTQESRWQVQVGARLKF